MKTLELMTLPQIAKGVQLLDTRQGELRVLVIHDTGTHMNIINPEGKVTEMDVDDFPADPEDRTVSLGQTMMDRLR